MCRAPLIARDAASRDPNLIPFPMRSLSAVALVGLGLTALEPTSGHDLRAQRSAPPSADLVIRHGVVRTQDVAHATAQAVAMRGDTIVAVGTDAAIGAWIGPRTRVIDAKGRTVLPGFTDGHVHVLSGSLGLSRVNLEGARDVAELRMRLTTWRAANPGTGWVLGRGWNYAMFGPEALPHKKYLDDLFPDRPVLLTGYDGHTSWANSKALALAGVTKATPDPANGVVVKGANGEPTGALKEKATALVSKLVPQPTRAENAAALIAGMKHAASVGVTRVHSAGGDFDMLPILDSLRSAGALTLRFDVGYFLDPPALRPADLEKIEAARTRYTGEWVAGGLVKLMIDGVIESHTAAMLGPYSDDPSTSGSMFWQEAPFAEAVKVLDGRGIRLMTHAIGEKGVRTVLDAYAAASAANGARERRHRIEHIETVTAADIPRFGKEGVIASMQPLHAYPDVNTVDVWARNIGPDRAGRAWAWTRIRNGGGRLAFGSDWPVVTLNPWPGVQVGVTRMTEKGTPVGGFVPSERLSREEMIAGYTIGAAVAGRHEAREGSIAVGKVADVIVLARDPMTSSPAQLAAMTVELTVSGGRVVHERK